MSYILNHICTKQQQNTLLKYRIQIKITKKKDKMVPFQRDGLYSNLTL